ncbi:MAG: transporter substrate-binding domain-containing protein [Verrucomicrobiia bacterium]
MNLSTTLAACRQLLLLGVASLIVAPAPLVHANLNLTEEQTAWLSQHATIRVGLDPDWPPFSFIGPDGQLTGADREILEWIGRKLGVRFEFYTNGSWPQIFERLRQGQLDMTAATAWTESRGEFLLFSEPYFPFPIAIIARTESPFLIDVSQLRHKQIASPRLHVTTEHLQRHYPDTPIILTANTAEALRLVSAGAADAAIAQLAHASHLIRELNLRNLKIAGFTRFDFDLRYAIRPDWPELVPILNQALAAMPESVKADIHSRWIILDPPPGLSWDQIRPYTYAAVTAIVLAGAFLLIINRLQAREIDRRRQIEADLRRAHETLSALNEDKTNLMQMMAHDLRGPLTGILMATDLIQQELGSDPKAALLHLDEIRHSAERMRRLAVQLVTVDALESGQQTLHPTATDLTPILTRAVAAHQAKATRKEISLTLDDPGGPAMARADPIALERILDNLISNALKYTPYGGSVQVRLHRDSKGPTISIRDSGPGFTPEDRKNLFKKFARLSARPTASETSVGLGLAVVKALMDGQNALVQCLSPETGGTEFRLTFPQAS